MSVRGLAAALERCSRCFGYASRRGRRHRQRHPPLVRPRMYPRRLRAHGPRRASRLRAGGPRSRRDRLARIPRPRARSRYPTAEGRRRASVRTAAAAGGDLRVVLELNAAAKAKTFLLAPNEQYGHRLVVDLLEAADDAGRAACAPCPPSVAATSSSRSTRGTAAKIRARAAERASSEKDVVLAIARRVAEEIDAHSRHARRARAQRRLLRAASQAHGDRARGAGRLLHVDPRRFVSRLATRRARPSTCCRRRARATRRRCSSRSARTRPT